jgi:RNA polymerase sigma factor (sigma-70 family)
MPRILDHDGRFFEQLRPRLTAISRRIVGSDAEAEDVVQDCFIKWHGTAQGPVREPAAWLTTVVRRQSIDRLRTRVREALAAAAAADLAPDAAPALPEAGLLRSADLAEALARLLARLSPAERMALVLREVFECDHATIAAALGTKPANARQYLARARRRLDADDTGAPPEEKHCRALVRRFQAAINGRDVPAMMLLLAYEQPVSVHAAPAVEARGGACANDAWYGMVLAA